MSRHSYYPARERGVIAVPGESGLRLRRRDAAVEFVLNATAVLIWHACDGRRTLAEMVGRLKAEWPDYPWAMAEVAQAVDKLVEHGMVRQSREAGESGGIVRVGFLDMWPGFDPCNNYFLWMLSHRAAVIATDPRSSEVDMLFFAGDAADAGAYLSREDPDCVRIRVDAGGERRRAGCDFAFELSGEELGRTGAGYALAPWIDAVDWWGCGTDGTKVTLAQLTQSRLRPGALPPAHWAVLDAGATPEAAALKGTLEARYGQPRPLRKTALDDKGDAPAIDREAAAGSGFALIAGCPAEPPLAGTALLVALGTGAVPFYSGDRRLVAGINERAYVDTGIYASADQVVAVTDMLRRDTALYNRLLAAPPFYRNRLPGVLDPETVCGVLWQELLGEQPDRRTPSPPVVAARPKRLSIAMATYDDYDGVYFSIQAVRLYHPEILDDVEFVIVDNNPDGPHGKALRHFLESVPATRYIPNSGVTGTAVRDFTFRSATGDSVLCMDSHVYIVPGALKRLLDYLNDNPDSEDLLQGPRLRDDLSSVRTHFEPRWRNGMYGTWSLDERGRDPDAEPFDIPMQGLGLFACRKEAWLGFNPDFRGFGGEEGYIHEKFRRAGRRTLCLPFLRWVHRFGRPAGVPYNLRWDDRIRNYLLGFREVGLDTSGLEAHFAEYVNTDLVARIKRTVEDELRSPFAFFDGVYSIDLNGDRDLWMQRVQLLNELGIAQRVRYHSAPADAGSVSSGLAGALREIIVDARRQDFETVLVFDGDAIFRTDAVSRLTRVQRRLDQNSWEAIDLGSGVPKHKNACNVPLVMGLHARSFDALLQRLPTSDDPEATRPWPASRLREALNGIQWATRTPAALATGPQRLPLDQYLV